jgi:hypothetical protein
MDAQITAAARALARGDALEALKQVALRDDPPGLALRGIALAQLGELGRARELLRRAARAFGAREPVARARCVVAEAEIALATRELGRSDASLVAARRLLDARGDRTNALHARGVEIRRLVLLGRVERAAEELTTLDRSAASPLLAALLDLLSAEVALRRIRTGEARSALESALRAAQATGAASLVAEVERAAETLTRPAARRIRGAEVRPLLVEDVAALHASRGLVVDGCRRVVRDRRTTVSLARRPVLFALARALAEAWPGDATRADLILRAFGATRPNDSHRARLRVEIGRLRSALRGFARVEATALGFALSPRAPVEVVAIAPPTDDEHGAVLALLADGSAWSSSALALALGASQRTTQRALVALEEAGKVRSSGRARAQRWVAPPLVRFTTLLLLPAPSPVD